MEKSDLVTVGLDHRDDLVVSPFLFLQRKLRSRNAFKSEPYRSLHQVTCGPYEAECRGSAAAVPRPEEVNAWLL